MSTYWILLVHFNIGFFISPRISRSVLIIFWCLLTSVIFNQYTMYYGLPPCNFKNIEAMLFLIGSHRSCTMSLIFMYVRTSRSLQTAPPLHLILLTPCSTWLFTHLIFSLSLSLSLSLSHIFSFNFYLPVCLSKNIYYGIEIISCFQHPSH